MVRKTSRVYLGDAKDPFEFGVVRLRQALHIDRLGRGVSRWVFADPAQLIAQTVMARPDLTGQLIDFPAVLHVVKLFLKTSLVVSQPLLFIQKRPMEIPEPVIVGFVILGEVSFGATL